MEAAKALYQLAPESIPAVYYLSSARLIEIEPMLREVNAAARVPVCIQLKRTVTRVLAVMETAKGETLTDWDRLQTIMSGLFSNWERRSARLPAGKP
jgi:hypothetical protein